MTKETKNRITRESCEQDLKKIIKSEIKGDLMIFICISAMLIPLAIAWLFAFPDIARAGALWICVHMVGLSSLLAPSVILLVSVIKGFCEFSLVKKGCWSIERDEVSYMVEGESHWGTRRRWSTWRLWGTRRYAANVIYFCRYGRYEVMSSATWGLTSSGDSFYLVVIHKKKAAIHMAFPLKLYEWDG